MTVEIANDSPVSNIRTVSFIAEPEVDLLVLRLKNANGATTTTLDFPVPALLEALRTVLGVITIDKADLPKVDVDAATGMLHAETARGWESKRSDVNTENLRKRAYALLAIADHADAHPPVDEAQVGALADLLRDALGVTPETVAAGTLQLGSSDDVARRLIATGRVEVQA